MSDAFDRERVLTPLLTARASALPRKAPLPLRMFNRFPVLQRIPAQLVGMGVRSEHIRSAEQAKA